jgi:hypothetical protein
LFISAVGSGMDGWRKTSSESSVVASSSLRSRQIALKSLTLPLTNFDSWVSTPSTIVGLGNSISTHIFTAP